MLLDKKNRVRQLNRVATKYDQYAVVQQKIAYRLVMNIRTQVHPPSVVIELGCRTGHLAQLMLHCVKPTKFTAIDIAEKMIEQAKGQVMPVNKVDWIVGDVEEIVWAEEQTTDLIISNTVLHWSSNPTHVLKNCWRTLRMGGSCMHTMMGPDTFQELRFLFRQVEAEMGISPALDHYPLRSAEEWEQLYRQAGFTEVTVVEHWHRVEYEDCRSFLQAIKGMGESFSPAKQSLFTSYRILLQVMQKYNFAYRSKTGVYATFHIIQCTVGKR